MSLYCLPYSGTGGVVYQPWVKALAPEFDVCPIELPGRWGRLREEPFSDLIELVEALGPVIAADVDRPYAFFGCSFGGLVAFELCRYMRRHGHVQPMHLFVAATRAPSVKRALPTLHMLSDDALIRRVGGLYGGLPTQVLESPDMRDMVLRVMRADLKCVENYRCQYEEPLRIAMTVFGGRQDPGVPPEMMEAWKGESTVSTKIRIFEAGHLFLSSHARELLDAIRTASRSSLDLASFPID
jgi:medium-chain acyl-[acyl-carrier-protein] hydrolase